MKTKVIAAFPGTGKSYFVSNLGKDIKAIDLDTNDFTQGYDENGKAIDQRFPHNYLSSIKEAVGQTNILLIGCQPEVLNLLHDEGINATLVYPERHLKEEYMNRFSRRGSPQTFNGQILRSWDRFLDYLEAQDNNRIVLGHGQYLSDVVEAF